LPRKNKVFQEYKELAVNYPVQEKNKTN